MHSSPAPQPVPTRRAALPWLLLVLDGLLVVGFAALGNRSHEGGLALLDVMGTAAPFLLGLLVSSLAVRFWRSPSRLWPDAVVVILGTVALGMSVRVLSGGGGTEWSFILVALGVLGVLLAGRRWATGRLLAPRHERLAG
ncbi:DUF3054 domain-containing protein [Nesterenkonia sp. E16_7]|uniref:DUF3054 domain-containing protein n=1 Tax=unclassified Nesterenkonia TaxID=2629769 RepID=UPI001A929D89|nr:MULTISPECIES: DUF3054 domain-containing protein [unclassified Nesterenkonia]MBO0595925.1 DUF3054 domain-containing protein [Nesterenkonia sp. E16_10]MBO0599475.1 DUF3054 domain-containing protein [Nesterenkonia sp. E16_7]